MNEAEANQQLAKLRMIERDGHRRVELLKRQIPEWRDKLGQVQVTIALGTEPEADYSGQQAILRRKIHDAEQTIAEWPAFHAALEAEMKRLEREAAQARRVATYHRQAAEDAAERAREAADPVIRNRTNEDERSDPEWDESLDRYGNRMVGRL